MTNRSWIPHIQIRSGAVLCYCLPSDPLTHKRKLCTTLYTGNVTKSTAKRIRRTVDIFIQRTRETVMLSPVTGRITRFRLTFVTLTISEDRLIAHREAFKKGLQRFLRWLRSIGARNYVWKAELQKRGQVHYHITTDTFIHWRTLRDKWNAIQSEAGWMQEYKRRHGHTNANSTDIHAVGSIKRLDLYISKYIAKADVNGKIEGKVWGCNEELQGAKFYSAEMVSSNYRAIDVLVSEKKAKMYKTENSEFYNLDNPVEILDAVQQAEYARWQQ